MTERPADERPHNRVAADLIIEQDNRIVLIKRKYAPFKDHWCLPGGHVEHGEQVTDAAIREAREETGIDVEIDELLGIYDTPDRDPRGPVISIVYAATPVDTDQELAPATDAKDAKWVPLDDLPSDLGFDHRQILDDYLTEQ